MENPKSFCKDALDLLKEMGIRRVIHNCDNQKAVEQQSSKS